MIIKVSFYDNDFTQLLEEFFNKFWTNIFLLTEKHKNDLHQSILDNDKFLEFEKLYKKTGEKFKTLNEDEKQQILEYIKENIIEYVSKSKLDREETTLTYLKKSLRLEFVDSIKDEWKNGEVVYYFTMADKYVTM